MGDPDEPRDPDLDHVPMAAEALDGRKVVFTGPDGEQLEGVFILTQAAIGAFGDEARHHGDDES